MSFAKRKKVVFAAYFTLLLLLCVFLININGNSFKLLYFLNWSVFYLLILVYYDSSQLAYAHIVQNRQYLCSIRIPEFKNFAIIKEIEFPILMAPINFQNFLWLFLIPRKFT